MPAVPDSSPPSSPVVSAATFPADTCASLKSDVNLCSDAYSGTPRTTAKLRRRHLLRGPLRASHTRLRSQRAVVMPLRALRTRSWGWRRIRRILASVTVAYLTALFVLLTWPRAQAAMIYLHWLRPPAALAPLDNLDVHRLSSYARVVRAGHLRGWHMLPPGPPFAPAPAKGLKKGQTDPERDAFFDRALRGAGLSNDDNKQRSPPRVVLFFHGNSGTRAFPFKRVDMLRQLNAHLQAHVVTFDYSGFGDSPGRPSELQFNRDAVAMYDWVMQRTAADAEVILYGKSLGTFAAVHISVTFCPRSDSTVPVKLQPKIEGNDIAVNMKLDSGARDGDTASNSIVQSSDEHDQRFSNLSRYSSIQDSKCNRIRAVILDSPPASVLDASMSHPSVSIFSNLPRIYYLARRVLRDMHDSVLHVPRIDVPLLILHGEQDRIIPIEQGMRIHASAVAAGNRRAEFVSFPTAGHNNANSSPEFLIVLHNFLSKYLRPLRSCE